MMLPSSVGLFMAPDTETPMEPKSPTYEPPIGGAMEVSALDTKLMLVGCQLLQFRDATPDGLCLFRSILIAWGHHDRSSESAALTQFFPDMLRRMSENREMVDRLFAHPNFLGCCDIKEVTEKLQNPLLYQKSYPGNMELVLFTALYGIPVEVITDFGGGRVLSSALNTKKALQDALPGTELTMAQETPFFLYHHASGYHIDKTYSEPKNHYGALTQLDNMSDVPSDAEVYIGGTFAIHFSNHFNKSGVYSGDGIPDDFDEL